MATKEQLDAVRPLAIASPNTGKRGKGKRTLTREELRREFEIGMGSELKKIIALLKVFIKKLNTQEIISNADIRSLMDLLEQLIGSAQKSGDTNINVDKGVFVLPSEIISKYKLNEPVERV